MSLHVLFIISNLDHKVWAWWKERPSLQLKLTSTVFPSHLSSNSRFCSIKRTNHLISKLRMIKFQISKPTIGQMLKNSCCFLWTMSDNKAYLILYLIGFSTLVIISHFEVHGQEICSEFMFAIPTPMKSSLDWFCPEIFLWQIDLSHLSFSLH